VKIRLLEPDDSIGDLTDMIHRAYAVLGDMGYNYTAVDQPVWVTRERIEEGECWVVEEGDRIIATCILSYPFPNHENEYFSVDGHAYINQLAVEPEFQNRGIAGLLLDHLEQRARDEGAPDIGLDTAEKAKHLIDFYKRRGYTIVDTIQYYGKTYKSVIMSKPLQAVS
jgi:ribosomal protein S18 acetylase RimI-like enzyme